MNVDVEAMRNAAGEASQLLKALANPDRLLLLCQMTEGEFCVGDLERLTGIRQPTLSQQLTVLRDLSMVSTRRDGKLIYYSITSRQAMAVMQVLYEQFCQTQPAEGEKQ